MKNKKGGAIRSDIVKDLSKKLKVKRTSVYDSLKELRDDDKLIESYKIPTGKRGTNYIFWKAKEDKTPKQKRKFFNR